MTRPIEVALNTWVEPETAFLALYGRKPFAVWLDGSAHASNGFSYMASAHLGSRLMTADVAAGQVVQRWPLDPSRAEIVVESTIFSMLDSGLLKESRDYSDLPFQLGWVGWFGYPLTTQTLGVSVGSSEFPDAAFLEIDRMVVFDHRRRLVTLVIDCEVENLDRDLWLASTAETLWGSTDEGSKERQLCSGFMDPSPIWRHDEQQYEQLIDTCLAAIGRGDAFQLCLTNQVSIDTEIDPVVLFVELRRNNPSPHAGLLRFGEFALVSSSPEQFLLVTSDGHVTSKPIKGTRPRGPTVDVDTALRTELQASVKERAENVMIVDLVRNDLSRVAALGSVEVTSLLEIESFRHVHQLVSTVTCILDQGVTTMDAVRACFPPGSMTGAPKISAVSTLNSLEAGSRGPYAGAFGYIGRDGAVDLAVTIRTLAVAPGRVSVGTGGGITALSDAHEEVQEYHIKARAPLAALDRARAEWNHHHQPV